MSISDQMKMAKIDIDISRHAFVTAVANAMITLIREKAPDLPLNISNKQVSQDKISVSIAGQFTADELIIKDMKEKVSDAISSFADPKKILDALE